MSDRFKTPLAATLCAILTMVPAGAMSAPPEDSAAVSPEIAELRGPTLPTNDLEASVAFFTTVLGLKANEKIVYNSPLMRAVAGAPEGPDIYVVGMHDRLKQFALILVSAEGLEINAKSNAVNAASLSWRMKDADAAYERAIAAGYPVLWSPDRVAEAEGYPPEREMLILSPSGHRILIIQVPEDMETQ